MTRITYESLVEGTKLCRVCRGRKNILDFHKSRYTKGGRDNMCAECRNKLKDPEANKRRNLKRLYGITPDQFDLMLWSQKNKCLICDKEFGFKRKDFPHVDHCHKTGEIRGLLCTKCNVALGMMDDDINRLQKAIQYLGRYTCWPLLEEQTQC